MEFTYHLSEEDIASLHKAYQQATADQLSMRKPVGYLIVAMLAMGVFVALDGSIGFWDGLFVGLTVGTIALVLLAAWWMKRKTYAMTMAMLPTPEERERTVVLRDDCFEVVVGDTTTRRRWTAYCRFEVENDFVTLVDHLDARFSIPRRIFATPVEESAFLDFVQVRIGRSPPTRPSLVGIR